MTYSCFVSYSFVYFCTLVKLLFFILTCMCAGVFVFVLYMRRSYWNLIEEEPRH